MTDTYTSTGTKNASDSTAWTGGKAGEYPGKKYTITGAANNGSGLVRLTISSTASFTTGDIANVAEVGGTTEANAQWTVSVVDATHLDLQGSTFTNAWTSGGYIARNDKIVIASLITFDVDIDMGDNPTGDTPAFVVNSGGSSAQTGRRFLVNAGVKIRCRGPLHDLQPTAVGATFGAGSILEIDTRYASPSAPWTIRVASAYDGGQSSPTASARGWRFNGSAGNTVKIRATETGSNRTVYNYNGSFGGENCFQGSYVDFTNIGDITRVFWKPGLDNRGIVHSLSNFTINGCGELNASFGTSSGPASITLADGVESGTRTNMTSTFPLNLSGATADKTTGDRSATRVVWGSGKIKLTSAHGFVQNACYFHNGWEGGGSKLWGDVTNSFIRQTYNETYMSGTVSNCFGFYDAGAGEADPDGLGNPHFWTFNPGVTAGSVVECKYNVLYYTGASSSGNAILSGLTTTAHTLKIYGNVIMPNGGNQSSGAITIYNTAAAGYSVEIYKNTVCVAGQHGIEAAHLYGGGGLTVESPNRYTVVQDNLFFGTTAANGWKGYDTDHVGATNVIPPAIIRHNAGFRTFTAEVGANYAGSANGWGLKFTGAVPDSVGGLDGVDPGFIAPTRDLASWAVTRGSSAVTKVGREADGCAYIRADPTLTQNDLLPYLKYGFSPTHASYRYGDYAGTGVFGAVAWVSTGNPTVLLGDAWNGGFDSLYTGGIY